MKLLLTCIAAVVLLFACLARSAVSGTADTLGPASVKVKCGDVLLRIDGPKIWTISRIEYKNTLLGIEDSAYGTVCGFPNIGWLGTAHFLDRPDGKEQVKKLEFCIDGNNLPDSPDMLTGEKFTVHKISKIFDIGLDSTVELHHNRIYETAVLTSDKQVPVTMIYNFMHAWTPSASAVLARSRSGEELSATFDDVGRKEYALKNLDWAAVYDANSGKGAVAYLIANSNMGSTDLLIVNAPKVYRKYYVKSLVDQTIPADFRGTYKMVTGFFEAKSDVWQKVAREMAKNLKQ